MKRSSSAKLKKPPRLVEWLLLRLSSSIDQYSFIDDLELEYQNIASNQGPASALKWYWSQAIQSIPRIMIHTILWHMTFMKNYFKTTIRNLKKEKSYALISIMSLSIGITCVLLVTIWILDEYSSDQFHDDKNRIYQVLSHGSIENNTTTPIPLAPVFKASYPEIRYATRYENYDDALVSYQDKVFYENGIKAVDPDFFHIFTFPFYKGDPETAFEHPFSIVITTSIARKYFPDEDPLGKTLTMNHRDDLIVTGVMEDVPQNSTIEFDLLIPYEIRLLQAPERGVNPTSWGYWNPQTFIKVQENVSIDTLNTKIETFLQEYTEREEATLSLLSLSKRYFLFWNRSKYIAIFSTLGLFILIIACINFVNLSTARSAKRALEIGIRKIMGATRKQLIAQFMGESFLMSFAALFIAVNLTVLLLPLFNRVTEKQLHVENLQNGFFILMAMGLMIFTGILSGAYPAFLLSSFQPLSMIRKRIKMGSRGPLLRKILVIVQFAIAVFLLIGTNIFHHQLRYMKTWNMGYIKNNILSVPLEGKCKNFYGIIKRQLLKDEKIVGVTGVGDDLPYFGWGTKAVEWPGKDPNANMLFYFNIVDYDFIETLGIEMSSGRSFSMDHTTDFNNGVIVNQAMSRLIKQDSVIGMRLMLWDNPRTIIGVMKNCHFQPLTDPLTPFFLILEKENLYNMIIRVPSNNMPESLQSIRKIWNRTVPEFPFDYRLVEDDLNDTYHSVEKIGILSRSSTILAILIACIGLFGLTTYTVKHRLKEIGIRKVFGASISRILFLLSKEYALYVLIANMIAWPLVYWAAHNWLNGFAYYIKIRMHSFLFAGIIAYAMAVLSIGLQVFKGAVSNPADVLRYE